MVTSPLDVRPLLAAGDSPNPQNSVVEWAGKRKLKLSNGHKGDHLNDLTLA